MFPELKALVASSNLLRLLRPAIVRLLLYDFSVVLDSTKSHPILIEDITKVFFAPILDASTISLTSFESLILSVSAEYNYSN